MSNRADSLSALCYLIIKPTHALARTYFQTHYVCVCVCLCFSVYEYSVCGWRCPSENVRATAMHCMHIHGDFNAGLLDI